MKRLTRQRLRKMILREVALLNEGEGFDKWMDAFTKRKYTFYEGMNEYQRQHFKRMIAEIYEKAPDRLQNFLDAYMNVSAEFMLKVIDPFASLFGIDPVADR